MADATLFGIDIDADDFLNGGHLDPVTINGQTLPRFVAVLYAVMLEANAMKGVGAISTTSLAIGIGSRAFTFAPTSQGWDVGQTVRAASLADPANYMVGAVTATGTGSATLDVTITGGSGTHADWYLSTPAPGLNLPLALSQGGTGAAADGKAGARAALGLLDGGELTIASGAVTATDLSHTVDTEADAGSDDLATIAATNVAVGDVITLRAASDARRVYLTTGGNIAVPALLRAHVPLRLLWDGAAWRPTGPCVLIDDLEASGSASLSFVKGIGAGGIYRYDFHIEYLKAAATSYLGVRVSVDAGANWRQTANDYRRATYGQATDATVGGASTSETLLSIHPYNLDTGGQICGEFRLHDPAGTSGQLMDWLLSVLGDNTGTQMLGISGAAQYAGSSEVIDGVQFRLASNNLAQGRIYCIGWIQP